ncbi:MAG: hypothetical protein IPI22_13455 [Bacteroidetes bacterium]|nr:hypothetical protein [Bacteroidota bacterium]
MQINHEELIQSINQIGIDIKPEVVVADLINHDVSREMICVKNESVFKRPYRKEITGAHLRNVSDADEIIEISISRDGIYDLLPEGLFHQSLTGASKSVTSMVLEHKRFKEEENEARKFFQPLENEFFHQKVNIELIERHFFETINKEKDLHLASFWQLDDSLPTKPMQKIVELLPQSKLICGNHAMMQSSLSIILDEKVELVISSKKANLQTDQNEHTSHMILGLDSVLGNQFEEEMIQYEFKIGPLLNTSIEDYLTNKPFYKILHTFYDCFTPIEPEIITTFVSDKNDLQRNKDLFLGLNMQL